MDIRNNINLGEEIKNIVQDAVNKGDFNKLSSDIRNVVNTALVDVRKSMDWKKDRFASNNQKGRYHTGSTAGNSPNSNQKVYSSNRHSYSKPYNTYRYNSYQNNKNLKPVSMKSTYTVPVGHVSGIMLTIFGVIGSVAFGITLIVFMILGSVLNLNSIFGKISLGILPCYIISVILWMNGKRIRNRLKRFQRYISRMNGRNYCLIKDLSLATGLSIRATVKDLRKMIAAGMFPQGRIDDKKTCFMLNNESYELYLQLQENMKMKQIQEDKNKLDQKIQDANSLKPDDRKIIDEGRQFVIKIRNANIAIPGEEISRKLDRLEEVTGKIFDFVETHPDKLNEIRKFTEYFLPTTLKLLDAYRELDEQPIEGENIASAKKEIEDTMDTINLAFENLLDDLFEEAALDISTDISVLQTMLAQEGLTDNNMSIRNRD